MPTHPSTPTGHPGEEHTSIGNDPMTEIPRAEALGSPRTEDLGAPRGAPASEAAASAVSGAVGHEVPASPMPQGVFWQTAQGPGPGVVPADVFDGCEIDNPAGEPIGRVERVMVDLACGRLAYVVLELTPRAGGGLCAVPWPAFEIEPQAARLRVALSPDDFRQAPTFSPEHWPTMTDETWVEEVHRFFGCRPYWV